MLFKIDAVARRGSAPNSQEEEEDTDSSTSPMNRRRGVHRSSLDNENQHNSKRSFQFGY
jgi:hypothetical protein